MKDWNQRDKDLNYQFILYDKIFAYLTSSTANMVIESFLLGGAKHISFRGNR